MRRSLGSDLQCCPTDDIKRQIRRSLLKLEHRAPSSTLASHLPETFNEHICLFNYFRQNSSQVSLAEPRTEAGAPGFPNLSLCTDNINARRQRSKKLAESGNLWQALDYRELGCNNWVIHHGQRLGNWPEVQIYDRRWVIQIGKIILAIFGEPSVEHVDVDIRRMCLSKVGKDR